MNEEKLKLVIDKYQEEPGTRITHIQDELIPATNIEEFEQYYLISADMPGVDLEDIVIELGANSLHLRAVNRVHNNMQAEYLCKERCCGIYVRHFTLNGLTTQSSMELTLEQGVLIIKVDR